MRVGGTAETKKKGKSLCTCKPRTPLKSLVLTSIYIHQTLLDIYALDREGKEPVNSVMCGTNSSIALDSATIVDSSLA